MSNHLLIGCSFTDPLWQEIIPWSVYYSNTYNQSYIVAKAGMGIKGICSVALDYAENLDFSHVVIILPSLWRLDIEMDHEGVEANGMVDLLEGNKIISNATRKWVSSGGLNNYRKREQNLTNNTIKVFDWMYKHSGFLSIIRNHIAQLRLLLYYFKERNITYTISAIQDPLDQLIKLDYIREDVVKLLNSVGYKDWLRFNGTFIDGFLKHNKHPSTEEHKLIGDYIWQNRSM